MWQGHMSQIRMSGGLAISGDGCFYQRYGFRLLHQTDWFTRGKKPLQDMRMQGTTTVRLWDIMRQFAGQWLQIWFNVWWPRMLNQTGMFCIPLVKQQVTWEVAGFFSTSSSSELIRKDQIFRAAVQISPKKMKYRYDCPSNTHCPKYEGCWSLLWLNPFGWWLQWRAIIDWYRAPAECIYQIDPKLAIETEGCIMLNVCTFTCIFYL